jgi:hypothetical protein
VAEWRVDCVKSPDAGSDERCRRIVGAYDLPLSLADEAKRQGNLQPRRLACMVIVGVKKILHEITVTPVRENVLKEPPSSQRNMASAIPRRSRR